MTPERWARFTELFEAALEQPAGGRTAFLARECADDPALQHEVEAVLDSHERAGSFGETPAFQLAERPRAATLAAGSHLGRYEIVAFLDAGGMGEVYRARDPHLGRDVAIKILPGRGNLERDQLEQFDREARAAGALNHPNILAVYDIGFDAGAPYVVSELLEGETLRARLRAGACPPREAIDLALQIASGLTVAHGKGIVHRDLKPANLFITTDGPSTGLGARRLKILDFGLARQIGVSSLVEQGLVMGTAAYMSPEQVRGAAADARSDVFAFGAVLYEMLTGVRAFDGESALDMMNASATSEPRQASDVKPDVPAALADVVRRCLEKDPERRPQSMREVASALEAVRPSLEEAHASPSRRWWAAMAATIVIAAAATLWLSVNRSAPPAPGASGRPAVAVMPFDDHSNDPGLAWLSSGLPSMLVTSLAQTPGVDVIGSERLEASLLQLGRERSDASARVEVARHAGAGAMLLGGLFRAGDDIRVEIRLEDLDTGRVVAAGSQQGRDLFALVDALAADLRAALDVTDRPAGRPLREVSTASLGAYELYVKGLDAWHNRRWGDARTLFEEAVKADPSFALARAQLSVVLDRLGEPVPALSHRRALLGQLDRLPERQRLLVEAQQEVEHNRPRARAIAERLIERYPDEEEAYDLIVHTYNSSRDPGSWEQTLAFMQRWARAIPGPGSGHFHNHYGYALIERGLYAEAEKEFRAYIRVSPDEANPYDSLAELFLLTGRPAEALDQYGHALRLNPLFGNSYYGRAYAAAMLGRYDVAVASVSKLREIGPRAGLSAATISLASAFIHSRAGRYRDAESQIGEARRLARDLKDLAGETDSYLVEGLIALERRQTARAREAARQAGVVVSRMPPDVMKARRAAYAHLTAGAVEAYRGSVAEAALHLAAQRDIGAGDDGIQLAWQQGLAGEIALADKDFSRAEAAFGMAEYQVPPSFSIHLIPVTLTNNLPFRDGRARVLAARGGLHAAVEIYRRLNEPDIASKWTAVLEPRLVLASARLAARAGDRHAAIAEYQKFLELWKEADADLPELAEARAYVRMPAP